MDLLAAAQKDGPGDPLIDDTLRRADDALVLAFGENDALRIESRLVDDPPHDLQPPPETGFEPVPVFVQIDLDPAHAGIHGGRRGGGGDPHHDAGVERLRDQLLAAESEPLAAVAAL